MHLASDLEMGAERTSNFYIMTFYSLFSPDSDNHRMLTSENCHFITENPETQITRHTRMKVSWFEAMEIHEYYY